MAIRLLTIIFIFLSLGSYAQDSTEAPRDKAYWGVMVGKVFPTLNKPVGINFGLEKSIEEGSTNLYFYRVHGQSVVYFVDIKVSENIYYKLSAGFNWWEADVASQERSNGREFADYYTLRPLDLEISPVGLKYFFSKDKKLSPYALGGLSGTILIRHSNERIYFNSTNYISGLTLDDTNVPMSGLLNLGFGLQFNFSTETMGVLQFSYDHGLGTRLHFERQTSEYNFVPIGLSYNMYRVTAGIRLN